MAALPPQSFETGLYLIVRGTLGLQVRVESAEAEEEKRQSETARIAKDVFMPVNIGVLIVKRASQFFVSEINIGIVADQAVFSNIGVSIVPAPVMNEELACKKILSFVAAGSVWRQDPKRTKA